jgi:hypothetical protein
VSSEPGAGQSGFFIYEVWASNHKCLYGISRAVSMDWYSPTALPSALPTLVNDPRRLPQRDLPLRPTAASGPVFLSDGRSPGHVPLEKRNGNEASDTTIWPRCFRDGATISEHLPAAFGGILQMSVYKFVMGLVGLVLAAAVLIAVVGVATVFAAPVAVQENSLSASPSSWGCAQEPWPYGCQWRAPVKRVFIRGPRPE